MHRIIAVLVSAAAVTFAAPSFHSPLIVGGVDTTIEEHPYQVILLVGGSLHCGGSIINENHIVTATHCVKGLDKKTMQIKVGVTNRNDDQGTMFDIENVNYNTGNARIVDGDVAILKLKKNIVFGPKAQPINLVPVDNEPRDGEILTVTGWGDKRSRPLSNVLQKVEVPSVDRQKCKKAYDRISDYMICAGITGKDSCQGDSGGPLVNAKKQLVGIVSWGTGCGEPGYPGVYTNVANPTMHQFIVKYSKE